MAQAAVRVKEQGTGKSPGHPPLEKGEKGDLDGKNLANRKIEEQE
jgi:hypothetical protein